MLAEATTATKSVASKVNNSTSNLENSRFHIYLARIANIPNVLSVTRLLGSIRIGDLACRTHPPSHR
jgi:hypothetical protein